MSGNPRQLEAIHLFLFSKRNYLLFNPRPTLCILGLGDRGLQPLSRPTPWFRTGSQWEMFMFRGRRRCIACARRDEVSARAHICPSCAHQRRQKQQQQQEDSQKPRLRQSRRSNSLVLFRCTFRILRIIITCNRDTGRRRRACPQSLITRPPSREAGRYKGSPFRLAYAAAGLLEWLLFFFWFFPLLLVHAAKHSFGSSLPPPLLPPYQVLPAI